MDALGTLTSASSVNSLSGSETRDVQRVWRPLGAPGLKEARTCFHGLSGLPQVGRAQLAPEPPQGSHEQGLRQPKLTSPSLQLPPQPQQVSFQNWAGSPQGPRHHGPAAPAARKSGHTVLLQAEQPPTEPRNHLSMGWQAVEGLQGVAWAGQSSGEEEGWNPLGEREGEGKKQRENEYGKGEKVGQEGGRQRGLEAWKILDVRTDMRAEDKGWRPVRKHRERC